MEEQVLATPAETTLAPQGPNAAVSVRSPATACHEVVHLFRLLYNHNPFYIISAYLVLTGLWQACSHDLKVIEAGGIALGLAIYTLLLALTAWLIIRLGRVWEDARSILLIVVLMFLAISVSLDPVLNTRGQRGLWFALAGFSFAAIVSEALLHGLALRLPALFRVPYYLVHALFYFYPLAISPLSSHPTWPSLYWSLCGFPALAGAVFLTLAPAIRRGARAVRENGSPWSWPIYPWALFGMLGLCVCMRAYYLCESFLPVGGKASIFGWYFLVPFFAAVTILLIEAAAVSQSSLARRIALAMPVVLLALSVCGHRVDVVYLKFLNRFQETMPGSPLYVTLLIAIGLYAYAWSRSIRGAGDALTLALALLAFITPSSRGLDDWEYYRAWPLVVVGLIQYGTGLSERRSWRVLLGAAVMMLPVALLDESSNDLRLREVFLAHATILIVLFVGAKFHDSLATAMRFLGAPLLAGVAIMATAAPQRLFAQLPAGLVFAYPLLPIGVALWYGHRYGGPMYYAAATLGTLYGPSAYCWAGYRELRAQFDGIDKIAWGIAFFLLAAVLSLAKAGYGARLRGARAAG